jgi:hypothetical protein
MLDVFKVATEFRFDIGHAVLASETLQGSVQGISDSADEAISKFKYLGATMVASMGLGGGGIVGVLYKALQVSDKFQSSQLGFANVISANMKFLTGNIDTFNERMGVSRAILQDIAKTANKFSLDEGSLLNMTKLLAPVLIPHGAAGKNMGNAIDMGRNVLKASPTLGLNPGEIEGQLVRTIMGQASMGDTLFRRLISETSAFSGLNKGGKQGGSQAFNAMSFEKRFAMLHAGLNQFANDQDVINGNARTLSATMMKLKGIVGGMNSILLPLGDTILPPIVNMLHDLADVLDTKVRPVIANLAKMLKGFIENPEALLATFMQIRHLGRDVKRGSGLMGVTMALSFMAHAARFLGIQVTALLHPFRWLASGLLFLVKLVPWMAIFTIAAKALWFALSALAVPMLAAVAFFQLLSRAAAIAHINDVKNLVELMPQLTALLARLKQAVSNMLLPFTLAFEALAQFIAPLFQMTMWIGLAMPLFDAFVSIMEGIGTAVVLATASLQGLFFALFQFIDNVKAGKIFGLTAGMGDAFNAGVDDFLNQNANRLKEANGAVANQVTNIGKVEIRNDFKEQQEPDRIAFTVKEQLMKAARNPRQGRGTGLQNAFAR